MTTPPNIRAAFAGWLKNDPPALRAELKNTYGVTLARDAEPRALVLAILVRRFPASADAIQAFYDRQTRTAAGGRARAAKLSASDRQTIAARAGRASGRSRNNRVTPERRSEIARDAAAARWSKGDKV